MIKKLNFAGIVVIQLLFNTIHAQDHIKLKGDYILSDSNVEASGMKEALRQNLITNFTVNTPVGLKTFSVKLSEKITSSATPNQYYYEGKDIADPQNKLWLQLKDNFYLLSLIMDGKSYTFAQEEKVKKAEFYDYFTRKNSVTSRMTEKTIQSKIFTKRQENAVWIDEASLNDFSQSNKEMDDKEAGLKCSNIENTGDNQTNKTTVNLISTKYLGLVGKRDVVIHLYNYGDVSSYAWGKVKAEYIYCFSRYPFENMKIDFIEHTAGSGLFLVNNSNLSLQANGKDLLDHFYDLISNNLIKGDYLRPEAAYNSFHQLLIQNPGVQDAAGMAYNYTGTGRDKYSWAQGWSSDIEYAVATHEFSHNLGANHTSNCVYGSWGGWWTWWSDLMVAATRYCHHLNYNVNQSNINVMNSTLNDKTVLDEKEADGIFDQLKIRNMDYAEDLVIVENNLDTEILQNYDPIFNKKWFEGQYMYPLPLPTDRYDNFRVYKIKFPKRKFYQLKITAGTFDTYLYLLDKNGNLVAKDDDSGGDTLSKISGTFNEDYYYVIVGSFHPANKLGPKKNLKFKLAIRYGYYNEGWNTSLTAKSNKNLWKLEGPSPTGVIETGDGNVISIADFGLTNKTIPGKTENVKEQKFILHPNPVDNGILNISTPGSGKYSYSIFDFTGRKIRQDAFEGTDTAVRTNDLSSGIYMIKILSEETNAFETQKIIIP